MNILTAILLVVFFLPIICFGILFLNKILNERRLIALIPLSFCIGSSFYVVLIHFLSYVCGVKKSTYLSFCIFCILSLYLFLKPKTGIKTEFTIKKANFLIIFFFSLSITFLCSYFLMNFNTYDPVYLGIANFTKSNTYPPPHPYSPEAKLAYHYGVILYGSALQIFSGLDPWYSLIPIQIISIFITPLSIFLLIHSITNNFPQSLFAALIGCLCANLTSLELFSLINPNILSSFLRNPYQALSYMNESGFAANTIKSLISPNISVAIPLCIIFFYLCTVKSIFSKIDFLTIFLISAFLYFSYEAFWFPEVLSIFLYHLYSVSKSRFNYIKIKALSTLSLIFLITPFLIGGVLSKSADNVSNYLYFHPKSYIYSWVGLLPFFYDTSWLENNRVISQGDGYNIYKVPFLSKYFFVEMGIPLISLPLILLWLLIKKENKIFLFLMLSGTMSFLVPFLFNYLPGDFQTIRFFIHARLIFSILLGLFLGKLFQLNLSKYLKFILQVCIILLITTSVIPAVAWVLPSSSAKKDYRNNSIPKTDKKSLMWLFNKAKPGDRGIGPTNIPHENFDLICTSGVYGASLSPSYIFEKETRKTAITTLNPCLLKELKIRWVYLNNDLLKATSQENFNKLKKEKVLVLRYKIKERSQVREIYEFIPKNTDTYCNKDYKWALGKLHYGRFMPLFDESTKQLVVFNNYQNALQVLNKLKKQLDFKEAYWFRVEAIRT